MKIAVFVWPLFEFILTANVNHCMLWQWLLLIFHSALCEMFDDSIKYINCFFQKRDMINQQTDLDPFAPIWQHKRNDTLKTKEQALTVIDTTLLKCYLQVNRNNYYILVRLIWWFINQKKMILTEGQVLSACIVISHAPPVNMYSNPVNNKL